MNVAVLMQTRWLIISLSVTLAATFTASAGDQVKDSKASKATVANKGKTAQPGTPQEERNVLLTGSYIKQDIRRSGRITNGANHVEVIDRATIERSGAADLKQVLALTGVR
jgi:outer membrane cobalamin receptor